MPLVRRVPKRGFKNPFRVEYAVVNVGRLDEVFEPESVVTPEVLRQKRIIKGKNVPVKILGDGELHKPLTVIAHKFSATAREKIISAGGKCEVIKK